eukprot:TRINITY_DN632_c0_g1_i1.p1 TRINITY_DN632_c0_g1~~TRINITY_DN632_c0_g1_i1.p1  ORF type:complete len:2087 (+),score=199.02 TRINITY_DN632_c0_g1_i1:17967-24227(+)
MPTGRASTNLRSHGAMKTLKYQPDEERAVPSTQQPAFQQSNAKRKRKPVQCTPENLAFETDVNIALPKRKKRKTSRIQSIGNRIAKPPKERDAVSNGLEDCRLPGKLKHHEGDRPLKAFSGFAQSAPHHQPQQLAELPDAGSPGLAENAEQDANFVTFPFNKRREELTSVERDTIELFPIPLLWNKKKSVLGPRFTNLSELTQFLRSDTECCFHIGEEYVGNPGIFMRNFITPKFHQQVKDLLKRTGVEQRIPILNPKRSKIEPPQKWPLITEYQDYVLLEHDEVLRLTQREKSYRPSGRKRLFCAEETSVLGLGPLRIRALFLHGAKGNRPHNKRGKNREQPEADIEGLSTEVGTQGTGALSSRCRSGSTRSNPKVNLQTEGQVREISNRPKRKRRPNVLYSDAVFCKSVLGLSDIEDTRKEAHAESVPEPIRNDPPYASTTEQLQVSADCNTEDVLGTDSSENEVEIPVHLVTISNCIDYVPDGDVYSSSACSFQTRDESSQEHADVPSIVDKLDESDGEDSHDPLFAEVEDEILRRIDEEASRKLLSKHVLDQNTFGQDAHIVDDNVREVQEGSRTCPSRPLNVKVLTNDPDRIAKYEENCGEIESGEKDVPLRKKDGDTYGNASVSKSRTSSAASGLPISPKKGHGVREDSKEAKMALDSSTRIISEFPDTVLEQNPHRERKDPSTAKYAADVQDYDLRKTCPKRTPSKKKRSATLDAQQGTLSKRARVRPDDIKLVRGPLESEISMIRNTNESTNEQVYPSGNLPKSVREEQSSDSHPEAVYANTPTTDTNVNGIVKWDSVYVYLWDHETCSRIEEIIPLRTAVSKCLESDRFSVYDGQDYDFGDLWSLNLTAMTEKDMSSWRNRDKLPGKIRKVRVWNLETGGLRTHYRSPAVQRLAGWLESNPENVVFSPSMILPCDSKTNRGELSEKHSCVRVSHSLTSRTSFGKQIQNHVIQRIRDLRIRDIPSDSLSSVQLWNTARKKTEPRRSFASHAKLLRFLFANPWLEPLCGQDQLFELESFTSHKLIRVHLSCAASIATYWDCEDQKVYDHKNKTGCRTIGEFLASSRRYLLYLGQDTPYFQSLVNYNDLSRSPGYPVLVKCGAEIQRIFFSKGWVTVVIDPSSCSTACAVFWNKQSKTMHMQPLICERISINSYLERTPHMEIYAGQNQPATVQEEMKRWIKLMKACCPQERTSVVLLTRSEFAPLRYRAVAWPNFSNECGIRSIHNRKVSGSVSSVLRDDHQRHKPNGTGKEINAHVEQDLSKSRTEQGKGETPASDILVENCCSRELNSTDGNSGRTQAQITCESTSEAEDDVIVLEPSVCTSIESDDMVSEDGMMSLELEEVSQNFEERLRAPARAAARWLTLIKEIGPRVLKQELVHDLRHTLYENTTMEVGSISELHALVQKSNDLHFVRMAAELCNTLESLDISGCFTGNADFGYGSNDIFTVREDLESGKICTMSDVIRRFRVVSQDLRLLNEGCYLEEEVKDLKEEAENVIQWYMKEKKDILEREVKIHRLAKICERARQIGFRKQRNRDISNKTTASEDKAHNLAKRASSGQARVTFMNYRDEKGNSVMGKRTSVRVFGLPVERRACQRESDGARPCHVCGREVFEADEGSLACGNRFFGRCNEFVCKACLESVTSMEPSEFISFRDGQEWICVHCRGLCPAGSKCLRNEFERHRQRNQLQSVRFTWPHEFSEPPISVLVSLIRRKQNGEFDGDPEQGDCVSLSRTSANTWSTVTQCCVGAYRAFVKADGRWVAGTTFFVFSPDANSTTVTRKKRRPVVRSTYYACPDRPRVSVVRSGPKVHWNVASDNRSGPVHAIPGTDSRSANHVVKDCSRVDGYDWQRAKRHNVVHWRPVIREADPLEVDAKISRSSAVPKRLNNSKTQDVTLTFSVKDHSSWTRNAAATPKPRPGLSYVQLCTEWNTFKYDEMLKSLWGIVTGRSGIHGIGLLTLTGYRKGDFIIEYAGDLIRTPLADIREARYEAAGLGTYLFKINEQEIVDATVQSNRARFTNHSCDPNMIARIIHVRGRDLVALQATRDIPRFAELTFDYKLPIEDKKVQCLCNSWNCVGVMN